MLKEGISGKCSVVVTENNSAKTIGSGTLDVFATPAMIALMEKNAWESVAPYLSEGECTVGIQIDATHEAPTPLGMTVTCESSLVKINGRRLGLEVTASDETGLIGKGTHERFLIKENKFQKKANEKTRT